MNDAKAIHLFIKTHLQQELQSIIPLSGSGSNRRYARLTTTIGNTYILTQSENIAENQTFFYFTQVFTENHLLVPQILAIDPDQKMYLQQDLGDINLLDVWQKNGESNSMFALWEKSLQKLAHMQITLKTKLDYNKCYDFQVFDEKVVLNDLFYFKNFLLDRLDIPYAKEKLISEFQQIAQNIKSLPNDYFLYRDFQSRNLMIHNNNPYFIDYQGGMRGFVGYDLVSFIHQAKANLSEEWKTKLKLSYFSIFKEKEGLTEAVLEMGYQMGLIMRYFQLLGAYGLRGLVERKTHFKESLVLHVKQMKLLLELQLLEKYPELKKVTQIIIQKETQEKINILLL